MLKASQSQMNRAALSALSTNSTPPRTAELLATMPTVSPSMRPNPVTSSAANKGLTSKKEPSSTSPSITSWTSNGVLSTSGTTLPSSTRAGASGWYEGGDSRLLDGVCVVGRQQVAAAADGAVHPGAAHLLQRHLLANNHFRHPGAAQVHGGVALHHDDAVCEGRDVRAPCG